MLTEEHQATSQPGEFPTNSFSAPSPSPAAAIYGWPVRITEVLFVRSVAYSYPLLLPAFSVSSQPQACTCFQFFSSLPVICLVIFSFLRILFLFYGLPDLPSEHLSCIFSLWQVWSFNFSVFIQTLYFFLPFLSQIIV